MKHNFSDTASPKLNIILFTKVGFIAELLYLTELDCKDAPNKAVSEPLCGMFCWRDLTHDIKGWNTVCKANGIRILWVTDNRCLLLF